MKIMSDLSDYNLVDKISKTPKAINMKHKCTQTSVSFEELQHDMMKMTKNIENINFNSENSHFINLDNNLFDIK